MKTAFTVFSFFCLTINATFCQDKSVVINRLYQSLQTLGETTYKVDTLDEITYQYLHVNLDSAAHYAQKTNQLARKIDYKKGLGNSFNMLGLVEMKRHNYQKSKSYFTEALNIRIQLGDYLGAVNIYSNLGYLSEENGKPFDALDSYELGMKILDNIPDDPPLNRIARMSNNLGRACKEVGKFKEAAYHYNKSIKIMEVLEDTINAARYSMNLGSLYYEEELRDTAKSRKYLNKSLQIFILNDDIQYQAKCLINLGNLYFHKEEYKKAMRFYASAKEKKDYLDKEDLLTIARNEGSYYHRIEEYDKALEIYNEALGSFQDIKNATEIAYIHNDMGNVFFDLGNYNKANMHLNEALRMANENQLFGLKTLVLSSIKNVKDRELFEKDLERKAMISNGMIAFAAFLIITLFFFRLNRKKRQLAEQKVLLAKKDIDVLISNQALKTTSARLDGIEEERKRIANALHDKIGVMLSTAKLYFAPMDQQLSNFDAKEKDKFQKANKILDEAYEEVRRISHNMASPSLTSLGLVGELKLLSNRIEAAQQLNIQVVAHEMNERLDNQLEMQLYQIIQELITNILKHANASEVSIELNRFEDLINVMVQDNGIGFEEHDLTLETSGIGLKNIKKRIEQLKGSFIIDSKKGGGTTISIDLPI